MKTGKFWTYCAILAFVAAVSIFVYLVVASKALSYLSSDPIHCINCHAMNTQYATWQHSSHATRATCVECHLPRTGFIDKYMAKARDGFNHSVAFTFSTYGQVIQISENAADRVQVNCISCHATVSETLVSNSARYHHFESGEPTVDRRCWDCHREVAHGKVRSLTTTPNNLGIRKLK